jgi:hypothetical protein
MIQDKIVITLKDLHNLQEELKALKKSVREEEKIKDEEYEKLRKMAKELRAQIKDFEEQWERDLFEDDNYNKLREMRTLKEEEVAGVSEKLFDIVDGLPPKMHEIKMDTEEGQVRVQINPDMKVFLNGKEEKRRM